MAERKTYMIGKEEEFVNNTSSIYHFNNFMFLIISNHCKLHIRMKLRVIAFLKAMHLHWYILLCLCMCALPPHTEYIGMTVHITLHHRLNQYSAFYKWSATTTITPPLPSLHSVFIPHTTTIVAPAHVANIWLLRDTPPTLLLSLQTHLSLYSICSSHYYCFSYFSTINSTTAAMTD